MKIVIITQGVSRIVRPLIDSEYEILGIIESAPRGQGTLSRGVNILSWLLKLKSKFGFGRVNLSKFCMKNKIPYRYSMSSGDAGLEDWVKLLNPDLIVVFGMSQLLRENIYKIPKYGAINLHLSFLPEYRGPNAEFWQYYDHVLDPGVTVHYIDEGEDTGDIILQSRIPMPLGIKSPDQLDRLVGVVGVKLLFSAIDAIKEGLVAPIKQSRKSTTLRARNIKKEEHAEIINWFEWPIERVWHLMRGTELWLDCIDQPGGLYRGQRWIVESYQKIEKPNQLLDAGKVMKDSDGYFVSCRDGKIRLRCEFRVKKALLAAYRFFIEK